MTDRPAPMVRMIALLLLPVAAQAGIEYQTDWSGGDGVGGPVSHWGEEFASAVGVSWISMEGSLLLDLAVQATVISSQMPLCKYAFPADMDGDGDMDVLSSSSHLDRIAWFENDGLGGGWDDHHVFYEANTSYHCVYPADLDSDGDIDVIAPNTATSYRRLEWFRNDDGVGDTWSRFVVFDSVEFAARHAVAADVDGSGTMDIIAPNTQERGLYWWEAATSPPDSSWIIHTISDGQTLGGHNLHASDLDLDGDVDVLCVSYEGLQLWRNLDGSGTSWELTEVSSYDSGESVHAADIDGDYDSDIVMGGWENLFWFENDGSCETWTRHVVADTLESARGVHAADLNEDGFIDILCGESQTAHALSLFDRGSTYGDRWLRFEIAYGPWFRDCDVADFDEDHVADVLAAATEGTSISWYRLSNPPTGWLLSSIVDVGGYPRWDSIGWVGTEPEGTDIDFLLRSSNDWEDMGAWCDTIYEPSSLAGYIDSTHRYIQYLAILHNDERFGSPILEEVRLTWSDMGVEEGSSGEELSLQVYPNPSGEGFSFEVGPGCPPELVLSVYDASGRVVAELPGSEGVYAWDGTGLLGSEVPAGNYVVRCVVGERVLTARFVKL